MTLLSWVLIYFIPGILFTILCKHYVDAVDPAEIDKETKLQIDALNASGYGWWLFLIVMMVLWPWVLIQGIFDKIFGKDEDG